MSGLATADRTVTDRTVPDRIATVALEHPGQRRWLLALLASLGLVGLLMASIAWALVEGVGIWGNNIPVAWALDIVSYDYWIGLATGALLTSAATLLFGTGLRGGVNRVAETVAVVAALAAAIYPILHLGRPWFFFWNLPYPNTLVLWPQFRSPLVWDEMDILGYLAVSLTFWYVGLIPDLAAMRDRSRSLLRARIYGVAALGWRGSAVHWRRWRHAYRSLAVLAVLIVVCLQTGASVMYAATVEPGWHDTLLPALFVATAAFTGLAGVLAVAVVVRQGLGLQQAVTTAHLDLLGKLLLGAGIASIYCYGFDLFGSGMGHDGFALAVQARRLPGSLAWSYWAVSGAAVVPVALLWLAPWRRGPAVALAVSVLVLVGMWADRFMLLVSTQVRDFLPSSQHAYASTFWEWSTFVGTAGLLMLLLLLGARYLPMATMRRNA